MRPSLNVHTSCPSNIAPNQFMQHPLTIKQDLIHARADEINALGLPAYVDAEEPEDDGYQGFQSWHVQSYLDDCLWPAQLRARIPALLELKRDLDSGSVVPVDVVEHLEAMATDNVIPHHWLHHGEMGGHAYYGGRDDYF